MYTVIAAIILAYLIGSIPNAVWIGKVFYGKDVRKEGSNNAGATNVIRVLGLKPGIVVLVLDLLKGIIPLFLFFNFVQVSWTFGIGLLQWMYVAIAVATVLGHVFPIFAGFRGGKGVATLVGVLIALYFFEFPIVATVFFGMLFLFRYVSLASICAAISLPITHFVMLWYWFMNLDHSWVVEYLGMDLADYNPTFLSYVLGNSPLLIFAILIAIFVPLTHIKNIKRLLHKEEPKFVFRKHSTE